jgi:UMF1 family MFS transporter
MLWPIGVVMGLALGGIGTSGRAMVGVLTPAHKAAEVFGLWGFAFKLAGVVGVAGFGAVRAWNEAISYGVLAGVFVVGAVGLLMVREGAGMEAARAATRAHLGEVEMKCTSTPSGCGAKGWHGSGGVEDSTPG